MFHVKHRKGKYMNDFVTIINTVGFPIACVLALGVYSYKTTNKIIALTEKVTNALTETSENMKDLAEAIKNLLERKEM